MTPKEKAKEIFEEIVDTFSDLRDGYNSTEIYYSAKKCALIAVDEILQIFQDTNGCDYRLDYWKEVKQEIEKL